MENLRSLVFPFVIFIFLNPIKGQVNSPDTTATNYFEIGNQYLRQGKFDSSEIWLTKSIELFEKANQKEELANAHKALSGSFHFQGNFAESIQHLQSAQNIYEELEMHENAGNLLVNISMSYFAQKRYEETLEKAMEAVEVGERLESDNILGRAYLMVGQGHEGLEENRQALEAYQKAKPIIEAGDNPVLKASLYNVMGKTLFRDSQFKASLAHLDKAYLIYQKINNLPGLQEVNRTRGKALTTMEKYSEAIPILEENLTYFQKTNALKSTASTYKFLSLCYEGEGRLKKALEAQRQYNMLNDSILGEKRIEEITELETRFGVQKKENEILRLEKENILSELKSARLSRIVFGALIALVFIGLLAFLFFRNANKMKKMNEVLAKQKSEIEEKNKLNETLVKEIHHRVKNNLQVLSSLLSIQADYIQDESAVDAVTESRNRVQSMGLIHQKLYMGENMAAIDMQEYLSELSAHLLDSFGIENDRIKLNAKVDVPKLDVDTAIPLGLIINELITNSMKYAFPNNKPGLIDIQLKIDENKHLYLRVADNGIGKTSESDTNNATFFGNNMVKILSKKLKGKIEQESEKGFETTIRFERYQIA